MHALPLCMQLMPTGPRSILFTSSLISRKLSFCTSGNLFQSHSRRWRLEFFFYFILNSSLFPIDCNHLNISNLTHLTFAKYWPSEEILWFLEQPLNSTASISMILRKSKRCASLRLLEVSMCPQWMSFTWKRNCSFATTVSFQIFE